MPEITNRYAQAVLNKKRYFTGKPCRRGHVAERYVSTGACAECLHITLRPIVAPNLVSRGEQWLFPADFDPQATAETFKILQEWLPTAYKTACDKLRAGGAIINPTYLERAPMLNPKPAIPPGSDD